MSSAFDKDKTRARDKVAKVRIPGWEDEAAQRRREESRSPKKKAGTADKPKPGQQAGDSRHATEAELPRVMLRRNILANGRPSLHNSPHRLAGYASSRRDRGSFFGSLSRGARHSANTQHVTIT